jgi:hypothetical protein
MPPFTANTNIDTSKQMLDKLTVDHTVVTKSIIFYFFYGKQDVVRSGGGKLKSKMTRKSPSLNKINELEKQIIDNKVLVLYFGKLRNRASNIAPPPCPK